jgi:serine/threonine protein kinase
MSFELKNGTIFAGRYKVLHTIAVGGMGTVYEVIHLETERRRALKIMLPQALRNADLRERFKREARVAARVESEFIVDVFDAGIDEATGMPFLVMELLRGEELGQRLARAGRLPPNEAVAYLQQTALALDKTHRACIVHRDLKPENLFLTDREDGRPRIKVLDFGLAKVLADSVATTVGKLTVGTPLYMAPEQFNPNAQISGAADIYALGMMAYTLVVGTAYWEEEAQRADNLIAFAMLAVKGPNELATVRAARRGVRLPAAFDTWFGQVTALDPTRRFRTATAAVSSLAEALGLVVTHPSVPPEQVETTASWPAVAPVLRLPPAPAFQETATVPLMRAATPIGASVTGWRGEPRLGPMVKGAVVIGGLILTLAMFFWWRNHMMLGRSPAVGGSGAPPAVSSAPPAVAPPAPSPSQDPPSASSASAEPEPPAFDVSPEPSASTLTPAPTAKPRPGRPLPSPPRKFTPKPTQYSQD